MQLYGEATESARLAIAALHEEVIVLRESMTVLADASTAQEAQLADIRSERDVLREELVAVTQHAERLTAHLEQVRTSTSWRVTGPYRVAGRLLKRRIIAPLQRPRQWRGCRQISRSGVFNASFYLGQESAPEAEEDVIMDYLAASQSGRPWGLQNPGMPQRRPVLGFHQLSYATHCDTFDELAGEDPLVHYLRTGQPDGPWKHQVITAHRPAAPPAAGLRILIHAHFHYPDLLDDLLSRLAANASPVDLLITTTSQAKAASIQRILATRDRTAKVVTVPNRGRDIGALLMHSAYLESYDVIGHLHGKRSPQQSAVRGNNWREFLWDHLVGCAYPMVDVIAEAFAADERLGLIFPEDPNLNHWDQNHDLAHAMAERMLLADALPSHFEFPKGTMFWARVAALHPLLDLGWEWDDFPDEPIESDGTVLHTLERMIPFAAVHAGFSFKNNSRASLLAPAGAVRQLKVSRRLRMRTPNRIQPFDREPPHIRRAITMLDEGATGFGAGRRFGLVVDDKAHGGRTGILVRLRPDLVTGVNVFVRTNRLERERDRETRTLRDELGVA